MVKCDSKYKRDCLLVYLYYSQRMTVLAPESGCVNCIRIPGVVLLVNCNMEHDRVGPIGYNVV